MIMGMGEAMSSIQGGEEGLQVLTNVLQRVRGGGDLEEEDDGYYSNSDEEGLVTAEMAARGVGEAGCVVVADSIWNKLVPHDLLSTGVHGHPGTDYMYSMNWETCSWMRVRHVPMREGRCRGGGNLLLLYMLCSSVSCYDSQSPLVNAGSSPTCGAFSIQKKQERVKMGET